MNSKIVLSICIFFGVSYLHAQSDIKVSSNTNAFADEGEAQIVINPTDSNKLVTGYMEIASGVLSFRAYSSSDGGDSWVKSDFDFSSPIAEDFPDYNNSGGGDIIFAFDKTGLLYCSFFYFLRKSLPDTTVIAVYMATSADNGKTFTLEPGDDRFLGIGKVRSNFSAIDFGDGFVDRPWLVVDTTNGPNQNKLYAGYVNFTHDAPFTALKVKTKVPGVSGFSEAVTAYAGLGQSTNLMVDHKGNLHYTFMDPSLDKIYHMSSSDGAKTFSSPHLVSNSERLFLRGGQPFINNRENAAPSLAIDGKDNLHLVWMEIPQGMFPKSYYSKSTDGGLNWETPLELSQKFKGNVFMPVVSSINDRVSISAQVMDNTKQSESYVLLSDDNGVNFETLIKVSTGVSNLSNKLSNFIGDYNSSVRTNCFIYSSWTDCRENGCKQYISKLNECILTGLQELTPLESTFSIASIYPNPVEDKLNLNVESKMKDALDVFVYNVDGKEMLAESRTVISGDNSMNIEVGHLSSGSYILKLSNSNNTFITRIFGKK